MFQSWRYYKLSLILLLSYLCKQVLFNKFLFKLFLQFFQLFSSFLKTFGSVLKPFSSCFFLETICYSAEKVCLQNQSSQQSLNRSEPCLVKCSARVCKSQPISLLILKTICRTNDPTFASASVATNLHRPCSRNVLVGPITNSNLSTLSCHPPRSRPEKRTKSLFDKY